MPPSCCNRSTSTTCRTSRTCGRSSRIPSTTSARSTRFPYVIYTTGIGYRTDHIKPPPETFDNPYDVFYEEAYRGRTYLLDDYREAIAMLLLRNGVTDVNTGDEAALEQARQDLLALTDAVNVKTSVLDYTLVPEGQAWLHQAWSGDFVSAQYYLPKGVDYTVLGYWYPPDGGGLIGSDTMAVLRSAKNPVLAHEFLNFMMDNDNAYANFYNFVGYQPPLTSLNPDLLVTDEVVPPHLDTTVVREEDFDTGYTLLELAAGGGRPVAEHLGRVQVRRVSAAASSV